MVSAFSIEDLEILCSDIEEALTNAGKPTQISLDMVGGSTLPAKVLNLIEYLDRRGYLNYLVDQVRKERPNLSL